LNGFSDGLNCSFNSFNNSLWEFIVINEISSSFFNGSNDFFLRGSWFFF
jgi:hypothetical protein